MRHASKGVPIQDRAEVDSCAQRPSPWVSSAYLLHLELFPLFCDPDDLRLFGSMLHAANPNSAYIVCWSRGSCPNPANAFGADGPTGKNPYGVVGVGAAANVAAVYEDIW
jgi:hypothetical protein